MTDKKEPKNSNPHEMPSEEAIQRVLDDGPYTKDAKGKLKNKPIPKRPKKPAGRRTNPDARQSEKRGP